MNRSNPRSRPCASGQRITKGPSSRKDGLMMAYKLLRMAEDHWRKLGGRELLRLVRAGVPFSDGEPVERDEPSASTDARGGTGPASGAASAPPSCPPTSSP